MSAVSIRVGIAGPHVLDWTVASSNALPDLTTVTAVAIKALAPGGASFTWPASIITATTTSLRARHTFAVDGSDVTKKGLWKAYLALTTPDGIVLTSVTSFTAKDEWAA